MTNTIEILAKIMGSAARVKLMRLFLFHPGVGFDKKGLIQKSKINPSILNAELLLLEKSSFIIKKETVIVTETIIKKKATKNSPKKLETKVTKKRTMGYFLNPAFPLLDALQSLLLESELVTVPDLPARFKPAGKIKLFVTSGIFMRNPDQGLDLLIVGDKLNLSVVQKTIALLESEIGKELQYATFDTAEFLYRIKMYDKLIRDLFDYPHQKLINQLPSGTIS